MNKSKIKLIKLAGYDLAKIIDSNASLNHQIKYTIEVTDDHVYISSIQENGDNTFDQESTRIEKELLTEYVAKRYGIGEHISNRIDLEESGFLKFTFLISNGATTGDREPAASTADSDGSGETQARPRIGRPKGTGKKLSVLPDHVHSGV